MISMGVAIDSSSSENDNALMIAIVKSNQQTALILIRAGADTNFLHDKDHWGFKTRDRSYMHLASEYGCNEVIQLLLEKGADPRIAHTRGMTPLYRARQMDNQACIQLLEVGS